jgi:hypothetical protein
MTAMCAWCASVVVKIRIKDKWHKVFRSSVIGQITHTICPECAKKVEDELEGECRSLVS